MLFLLFQKIIGDSNKLYNPDPIDYVVIPHEEFTQEMASDSVAVATEILSKVKEFMGLKDDPEPSEMPQEAAASDEQTLSESEHEMSPEIATL